MKKLMLILTLVFTGCLFGGDVVDRAHLLGSAAQRLQSDVATLPVWIETYDSVPNDDIKHYADNRIRQLTSDRGFIIVVTTHPRAWRISMNPTGFVGGEATRQIGDMMASRFKRGEFYPALHDASLSLAHLTVPVNEYPSTAPTPVQQAPQQEPVQSIVNAQLPPPVQSESDFSLAFWLMLGVVAIGAIGGVIYYANKTAERDRLAELRRQEEYEKQYAERQKKREAQAAETRRKLETMRIETENKIQHQKQTASEDLKAKANEIYSSYPTATARRKAISKYDSTYNYYSTNTGILNDPLMFYLYLSMLSNNSHPVYVEPPATPSYSSHSSTSNNSSDRRSSSSSDDDYYRRSSSSSSDSYGSSGGWDSGGSSFSSSDSGGSGGSW